MKYGGIFSYLLLLYGLFSIRIGYVYFNLSIIFYGCFGFFLFIREFCELLELIEILNTEDPKSRSYLDVVFSLSLFVMFFYGYVCHLSKYVKYITFGFIHGLFFSKCIYYFMITTFLKGSYILVYFLVELFICLIIMVLSIFIQNKYPKISIASIVNIAAYGIFFGINILVGGLPFLPYFILTKKYEDDNIYDKLWNKSYSLQYMALYAILLPLGYYKNYINYQIVMNKKLSKVEENKNKII